MAHKVKYCRVLRMHKRENTWTGWWDWWKVAEKKSGAFLLEKVAWKVWYVSTSTFWLDCLKPRNSPDRPWRQDGASSAYSLPRQTPVRRDPKQHHDVHQDQATARGNFNALHVWPMPDRHRVLCRARTTKPPTPFQPFSDFTRPSTRGTAFSLRSSLEVSVFSKSTDADNEILRKPQHAHSMPYHHMVKFSPPSDIINIVYKFLGMPP